MKNNLFFLFVITFLCSQLYSETNVGSLSDVKNYKNFVSSTVVFNGKVYRYYIVYDKDVVDSIFIETKDWLDDVRGYGGPINLQVYFSIDGKIKNVNVIEQNETDIYAKKVFTKEYLSQYIGKDLNNPPVLAENINSISGATISCNAVNYIIYESIKLVNLAIFSKNQFIGYKKISIPKNEKIKTGILVLVFVLSVICYLFRIKFIRYIVLIGMIYFLGIKYAGGLSISHLRNIFFGNIPNWNNIFFLTFIGLTLITTLIFGRLYCGWLCPFGAVTELLFNIKHFFEIKYKTSLGQKIDFTVVEDIGIIKFLRKLEKYFRNIKYLLLGLIFIFPNFISVEPFQYLFVLEKTNINKIVYLVIIIIFCILFIRLWCRYFCPLGGGLALISLISFFRLKIEPKVCLKCDICKNVCPTNAIVETNDKKKYKIISQECILCNRCRFFCGPLGIKNKFFKR